MFAVVGVDVDAAPLRPGADELDRVGDGLPPRERLTLTALPVRDHGAAWRVVEVKDAHVGHLVRRRPVIHALV